jgi:hypothetical protein
MVQLPTDLAVKVPQVRFGTVPLIVQAMPEGRLNRASLSSFLLGGHQKGLR